MALIVTIGLHVSTVRLVPVSGAVRYKAFIYANHPEGIALICSQNPSLYNYN